VKLELSVEEINLILQEPGEYPAQNEYGYYSESATTGCSTNAAGEPEEGGT
jgi:hypothetical protein